MSILNELKRLRKLHPNDSEFGNVISEYLSKNKTCCDDIKNLKPYRKFDTHPYGWDINGYQCSICGELHNIKIDK